VSEKLEQILQNLVELFFGPSNKTEGSLLFPNSQLLEKATVNDYSKTENTSLLFENVIDASGIESHWSHDVSEIFEEMTRPPEKVLPIDSKKINEIESVSERGVQSLDNFFDQMETSHDENLTERVDHHERKAK
jgi:hypothetical protein